MRYRRPLEFDDQIDVHLRLAGVTRATFQMAYLITVDDAEGVAQVRATGVTVHGCVTTAGRPTRLPAWLTEMATPAHDSGVGHDGDRPAHGVGVVSADWG